MSSTESPTTAVWHTVNFNSTVRAFSENDDVTAATAGISDTKRQIQNIFGPIMFSVVLLALLGNMTSIVVMTTKAFRYLSISRVIRCLAVSDSLYLICAINNQIWFRDMIGVDMPSLSVAWCRVINWSTRSTAIFSAWMVVLLAAERFFAIWFFEMARNVFSVKKMTGCIFVIIVITSCFNAVWTVYSDNLVGGRCVANARGDAVTRHFLVACTFLYVGIPAPTLLILNTLIAIRLHRHMKTAATVSGSVAIPHHRITAMLMGVTTVFLLFVPPIALGHMIGQLLGQNLFATQDMRLFIVGQTAQLLFEVI